MGSRGSSFGVEIISAVSPYGSQDAEIQELNVAGMTPMDRGSRFTNAEKTLDYLERKKLQETKEQVQVLDDYGYVTRAFQGDEHSCAVDDKTQQYARGKIVTHNHPSEFGGTFSDADISFLSLGMKELRASAKEGTYSIKAKKNANPHGLMKAYLRSAPRMQDAMREIALEMARKKYTSKKAYEKANRKAQLEVIHNWYQRNVKRYGFEYNFYPREDA